MNTVVLSLRPERFELRGEGPLHEQLPGGVRALVPSPSRPLRNTDVEAAIEHAEDWLMPFSRALRGAELQVQDADGELRRRFGAPAAVGPDEIERAFTRAADDVAFGRPVEAELLAGLVLLRELLHHGALSRVWIA